MEFADALRGAGFCTETWMGPYMRMVSSTRAVMVPLTPTLSDDELRHLLLTAGLTASEFLELLVG
jgi:hypothetical protein